jgi:hypothetical protein
MRTSVFYRNQDRRMTQRALSALQLDVLRRLRDCGHKALAEEAHAQWTAGRYLENEHLGGDAGLRADFNRANAEAKP